MVSIDAIVALAGQHMGMLMALGVLVAVIAGYFMIADRF